MGSHAQLTIGRLLTVTTQKHLREAVIKRATALATAATTGTATAREEARAGAAAEIKFAMAQPPSQKQFGQGYDGTREWGKCCDQCLVSAIEHARMPPVKPPTR